MHFTLLAGPCAKDPALWRYGRQVKVRDRADAPKAAEAGRSVSHEPETLHPGCSSTGLL
jgi:hypothetical protein